MLSWTFYPAFLATILSIAGHLTVVTRHHSPTSPRTLSELGVTSRRSQHYFRIVLWVCGTLFAISMYGFIIPRVAYALWQAAAWTLTYVSEMLLAVFPARGKTKTVHDRVAVAMGVGMLASAFIFALSFKGIWHYTELFLAFLMLVLASLTFIDRKRFVFYELPFIFIAHFTIVVACLALRLGS